MSSTNRGAQRQTFDYYATPQEAIRTFLREWWNDCPEVRAELEMGGRSILDPCAGGNQTAIEWEYRPARAGAPSETMAVPPTEMAYPAAIRSALGLMAGGTGLDPTIHTNDLRADSPARWHQDFIGREPLPLPAPPDLVITNPPFAIAMAVIQEALRVVRPGGWVAMLVRLNFFGSRTRFPFFRDNPPQRSYVHHERIGFTPDGGTDSIEYQHLVWQRGVKCDATILRVI